MGSILALSDNADENQWINTSEISTLARRRMSNLEKRQVLKSLVDDKILIEDKNRIRFYDDKVFNKAKNMYEEVYQSLSIDSRKNRVNFKKKRGWLHRMLYSHLY